MNLAGIWSSTQKRTPDKAGLERQKALRFSAQGFLLRKKMRSAETIFIP